MYYLLPYISNSVSACVPAPERVHPYGELDVLYLYDISISVFVCRRRIERIRKVSLMCLTCMTSALLCAAAGGSTSIR